MKFKNKNFKYLKNTRNTHFHTKLSANHTFLANLMTADSICESRFESLVTFISGPFGTRVVRNKDGKRTPTYENVLTERQWIGSGKLCSISNFIELPHLVNYYLNLSLSCVFFYCFCWQVNCTLRKISILISSEPWNRNQSTNYVVSIFTC